MGWWEWWDVFYYGLWGAGILAVVAGVAWIILKLDSVTGA